MRISLNEDLFEDNIIISNEQEDAENNGLNDLLISIINEKWELISLINDAVITLGYYQKDDIENILQEIVADEHKHIGMLLKAMSTISPKVKNILSGEILAEMKLQGDE